LKSLVRACAFREGLKLLRCASMREEQQIAGDQHERDQEHDQ
jgi:hypothetical protein